MRSRRARLAQRALRGARRIDARLYDLRRRHPKKLGLLCVSVAAVTGVAAWFFTPPDLPQPVALSVVNDVTQLNPTRVDDVITPRTAGEVQDFLRFHVGPVCIGGGRYSMGGQTATEGCVQLDMRELDEVIELDVAHARIQVESGITWREIQEVIDPHDLSLRIMQSYASFTVGGSLSVNVHGRYVGEGPLIRSVASIHVVLADGTLVRASPEENSDVFYGVIGGYGGLGVIVDATLLLTENVAMQRRSELFDIEEYRAHFDRDIRHSKTAIFHNGDLYPPEFRRVQSVTFHRTDALPTDPVRLRERRAPSRIDDALLYADTRWATGKRFREYVWDPIKLEAEPIVMRNNEASYDVLELEPPSRDRTTYALQEYFVPVDRFDQFAARIGEVLRENGVNALNLSIRHALPDPGSLLAWAREEVFSFVLYYAQGTSDAERREVGRWTRTLIDEALALGGTYYLPYQPHATLEQLRRGYPRWDEFVALKRRLDPTYRFRSRFFDRYLPPDDDARFLTGRDYAARSDLHRAEALTFASIPRWFQHEGSIGIGDLARLVRIVHHRTGGVYPAEEASVQTSVWITREPETPLPRKVAVEIHHRDRGGTIEEVVLLPRNHAFTASLMALTSAGARLRSIAGNAVIAMAVHGSEDARLEGPEIEVLHRWEVDDGVRAVLVVPVHSLHRVVPELGEHGIRVEHVFDY